MLMRDHDVEMTGWVTAKKKARTLKDLRDLVAWADKYGVTDEAVLDYGSGPYLYMDFLGSDQVKAAWIECGDHLVGDERWDVLIETHQHPEHDPPAQEEPGKEEVISIYYACDCELCLSNGGEDE